MNSPIAKSLLELIEYTTFSKTENHVKIMLALGKFHKVVYVNDINGVSPLSVDYQVDRKEKELVRDVLYSIFGVGCMKYEHRYTKDEKV
jgi:hypothetical protein